MISAIFDRPVEEAIHHIWFRADPQKREDSLAMLRGAANMGDGDAYYFLGQCYMGKGYVDPAVGLPDDRRFAFECFDTSLSLESAVGMFGTMFVKGYEPPRGTFVHPPYHSKKELWDAVSEKAAKGHAFCKYLIANAYWSCKAADFLDIPTTDSGQYERIRYEWMAAAAGLYKECAIDGLGIAVPVLIDLLTSGRYGAPIQRRTAEKFRRIGAAMGVTL